MQYTLKQNALHITKTFIDISYLVSSSCFLSLNTTFRVYVNRLLFASSWFCIPMQVYRNLKPE